MANPIFIPAPFARDSAYKNTIQKTRQSGQDQEDFTWTGGAPLITMTPKDNGGLAPKGQDFNGVLNAVSENTVFVQNGGRYKWSSDVISNYGGYESGSIIQSDDETKEFISLVDNNTSNPNVSLGSNWSVYAGQGSVPTASSTIAGVTKVLNNLNSTDTGSALSAAQGKVLNDNKVSFDNFSGTKSENGYQRIAGGLILQWCTTTIGVVSDKTVNFPIPFPNSCFSCTVTGAGDGFHDVYMKSKTESSVLIRNSAATGSFVATVFIFAIGY